MLANSMKFIILARFFPKHTTMLQHKDINKLSELKNGFTQSWVEPDFIFRSLKWRAKWTCLNRSLIMAMQFGQ